MKGKGAWNVASYEIDMHETLMHAPVSMIARQNALTESIVLHARQLCEMFLSRTSGFEDNVKLADLIPDDRQSARLKQLITELGKQYGKAKTVNSPCWVFNKMLLHPTKNRLDRYNYQSALDRVRPVLKEIVAEIESKCGQFTRTFRM